MAINQVESKSEEQKKQQVRNRRPVSGLKKSFQTKPRTPSTKKSNIKNNTQAWTKPNQKPPSNLKKYLIKFISYLKTKKLDSSLTQLTFKIIEWSFFITLCIIAGMFTKDVIQQFQAKKTIMAQSLIDITKLPTIVFCMNWGFWNFSDTKTFTFWTMHFSIQHHLFYFVLLVMTYLHHLRESKCDPLWH